MFSLWALYIRTKGGDKSLELDAATEIAYEWYSPYFNDEHSTSWDFSVPRTPYNEELLLSVNSNGEQYPLNDGYFEAYFQGLPWQQENEIDLGRLSVIKLTERRITLQFKQITPVFLRLNNKRETSNIPLSNAITGSPSSTAAHYFFLLFAETLRATGVAIDIQNKQMEQRAIVAISSLKLLQFLLPDLNVATLPNDVYSKLFYLYIVPSTPNFTGQIIPRDGTNSFSIGNTQYWDIYAYKTYRFTEAQPIHGSYYLNGHLRLHGTITARELLNELLATLCLRLCIRTFMNGSTIKNRIEIIPPNLHKNTSHIFGKLNSFAYFAFSLPRYPSETERTQSYTINYQPTHILPLIGTTEASHSSLAFRYFNREHLFQFHPPIEEGAAFYTETEANAITQHYKKNTNTVSYAKQPKNEFEDPKETWPNRLEPKYYYTPAGITQNTVKLTLNNYLNQDLVNTKRQHFPTEQSTLRVELEGDIYILNGGRWQYVGHEPNTQRQLPHHISYRELKLQRGRVILAPCFEPQTTRLSFDSIRARSINVYVTPGIIENGKEGSLWGGNGLFSDEHSREGSVLNAWRWLPDTIKTHSLDFLSFGRLWKKNGNDGGGLIPDPDRPKDPPWWTGKNNWQLADALTPVTLLNRYGEPLDLQAMRPTATPYRLYKEPLQSSYNDAPLVYSSAVFTVHLSPCVHALAVPRKDERHSPEDTEFYIRKRAINACISTEYLYFYDKYTKTYYPLFYLSGGTYRNSFTTNANADIKEYSSAYFRMFATAIEGDLESWNEEVIFAALYADPYPLDDDSRIGQQRIKKISLVLRKDECRIKSVRVVQFNKVTSY